MDFEGVYHVSEGTYSKVKVEFQHPVLTTHYTVESLTSSSIQET